MLDFVFVLLFPNDFLVFYSVFFGYFSFWLFWELFNGFGSNVVYSVFTSSFVFFFNSYFYLFKFDNFMHYSVIFLS